METTPRMTENDEKHLRQYVKESEENGHAASVFRFRQLLNEIDHLRIEMSRMIDKTLTPTE